MNVSKEMLLNTAKYQGYSFYPFELLRENHRWGKITHPSQFKVNLKEQTSKIVTATGLKPTTI